MSRTHFHKIVLLFCLTFLIGCGGSSTPDVNDDGVPQDDTTPDSNQLTAVPSENPLLPGYAGVAMEVEAGSIISVLVDGNWGSDPALLQIVSRDDITSGDLTSVLGETFYGFERSEGASPIAYVSTPYEVVEVVSCDPNEDYCSSPPFELDAQGHVSFYTERGNFYAITIDREGS